MSATINPDIVTDGLVLCLDAANPDCFRGEPTTNLITGSFVDSMGYSTVISSNEIDQYGVVRSLRKATINNISGWNRVVVSSSIGIPVLNRDYTISMWIKRVGDISVTAGWEPEVGPDDGYLRPNIESGYIGTAGASPQPNTVPTEWTYITYSFKYTVTTTTNLELLFYINGNNGAQILFSDPQIEAKSYATPYVVGTRGDTVETGGGLFDLSNNNNHGTIVRNAFPTASFYNSANKGSLVFDGVNDYMIANINTTVLDGDPSLTVDMFVRRRTGTNIGPSAGFWGIGGAGQGNSVEGWTPTANLIHFDVYDSTRLATSQFYPAGQFIHITWTKNGPGTETTNVKCYVNGIEVGLTKNRDATRTNQFNTSTSGVGICLGRINANANFGHAPIDIGLFKVYSRALTPQEVQDNYRATKGRYGL